LTHQQVVPMLQNYIKTAFRSLSKNRLYATLNIVGLAVGLSAGILVLLWITDELRYDRFHTNLSRIHGILQHQTQGGVKYTFEATPGPLAAALRAEIPEVARAARTTWPGRQMIGVGDKSYYERGIYAEPDFCNIFQFQALKGDPVAALREPDAVVITEQTAKKLFGNEDPIGKTLRHADKRDLRVAAVLADVPRQSSLRFDVLLPFRIFEESNQEWIHSWDTNSLPTWVELQPDADVAALNTKLDNFIQGKNPDAAAHIFAYPYARWRLYNEFKEGVESGGRIVLVWLLSIIGVFILLIACVNFMNLSTARSEKRAREVGVRKVVGAHRGMLIGQFLSESLVMSFLGLTLAALLAWAALPAFNRFFDKELSLNFSNWPLWSGVLLMGLLTGLVAGSYPALFLSRFQPIRVLKDNIFSGRDRGLLRKALVSFQFVISIVLIISTLMISKQIKHIEDRPLGYDAENLIQMSARGEMASKYEALKTELGKVPGVRSVSAATYNLIQCGSNTAGINWAGKREDQDFLVSLAWVRPDFIKTTGMILKEGRDFEANRPADKLCCLINETAVRRMELKNPIGSVLTQDTTLAVIGVVSDFVYNGPTTTPMPIVFRCGEPADMSTFFVRIENGNDWKQTISDIEQASRRVNPANPFEFKFVRDDYQKSFEEIRDTGTLAKVFGGLAILISCLGLFGLSSFVAERRRKEIGVRKVLGASMLQIWTHLSSEFLRPVAIAFVFAAPLAYWLMQKMMSNFEYRTGVSWWVFAVAGVVAVVVAIVTVSAQSIRAALANPVKSLRSE
jgi:putative ABC transport system permease protein